MLEEQIVIQEMSKEDIEFICAEENLFSTLCHFKSIDEYYDFKYHAAEGLMRFGGSFSQPLGHALAHADSKNTFKIILHWRKECDDHAALHRKFIENRNLQVPNDD